MHIPTYFLALHVHGPRFTTTQEYRIQECRIHDTEKQETANFSSSHTTNDFFPNFVALGPSAEL